MRLMAWNCNMALHRKFDALLDLDPDIAVISECAQPHVLREKLPDDARLGDVVWVGRNPHKGLGVFTFNGYRGRLAPEHDPDLEFVAPIQIEGETSFNLLAVWAQNFSGGHYRKDQPGPLRIALDRYSDHLSGGPAVVAGDLNNNLMWDRPGWRMNHADIVEILGEHGLESAYHARTGEPQGQESAPTIYWRDRTRLGPTYHLDYIFLPVGWIVRIGDFSVGSFEDWCGSGLSDHVPIVVSIDDAG